MYNIILVCTYHTELGKCNADELYKIIESIKPEIIFEEFPRDLFDTVYNNNHIPFPMPEIKAVRRYLENYKISHIPVDELISDGLSSRQMKSLFNTLKTFHAYAKFEEEQKTLASQGGFAFLNSKKNEALFEEKKSLEKQIIEEHVNKKKLSRIHELFYEEVDIREYEIIKKIYNYSEAAPYSQGLLLLGSGHRKSFYEKIQHDKSKNEVKINWTLYGD